MPIGAGEFASWMAACGPFDADRRVLAAVSGGADSMALAVLLSRWGNPLACIVDHCLRPESAAEAALTAARLAALGIAATIVRADLRPGAAAAARARDARYRLLLATCRDAGLADILLAHHAADQAETVRMRQDGGSAVAGLAGMARCGHRADARLLRPLLDVDPRRLRATLRAAGVAWVDDPTNLDLRTRRAQLRAQMDQDARAASLAVAAQAAPARAALEAAVAADLARCAVHVEGFVLVPGPIGEAALSAIVWAVSGRDHPPPRAALAAGLQPRTVHGVMVAAAGRLGVGALIAREPNAVAPPCSAAAGARWDGRFRVGFSDRSVTIGALGRAAARLRAASPLPSLVLRGLPAVWCGDELLTVPHLCFPDATACRNTPVWFVPPRPIAGAWFR